MTHPATLLKNSWHAYAHDFRAWLVLTAPLVALVVVAMVGSSFIPEGSVFGPSIAGQVATFIIILLIIAAAIFVVRVFSTAVIVSSFRSLNHAKPNAKESYRIGVKLFWPVLWVAVLRGLIVAGGLLLLVVPGVIWALRYSLATEVAAIEGKRGMAALHRSYDLTHGKLFETLVNFCTIFMIDGYGVALVISAVIFVFSILGGLVGFALPENATNVGVVSDILGALAAAIIVWCAIPLSPLATVAVYKDYSDK